MLSKLNIENLTVGYGDAIVLSDLSLSVEEGQVCAVLGSSGGGKTTLLRAVSGLIEPRSGTIRVGDNVLSGKGRFLQPEERNVGVVFQDYALFPHLTVKENLEFASKDSEILNTFVNLLGLSELLSRNVNQLSGGQKQRVALLRTLAQQPDVILLDEPFANLDQGLRREVRRDTLNLLKGQGVTALLVTHDPAEALLTSDCVAIVEEGRLLASGLTEHVYDRPASLKVARTMGDTVELQIQSSDGHHHKTALGTFELNGKGTTLVARPEHVQLYASDAGPVLKSFRRHGMGYLAEIGDQSFLCNDIKADAGQRVEMDIAQFLAVF